MNHFSFQISDTEIFNVTFVLRIIILDIFPQDVKKGGYVRIL